MTVKGLVGPLCNDIIVCPQLSAELSCSSGTGRRSTNRSTSLPVSSMQALEDGAEPLQLALEVGVHRCQHTCLKYLAVFVFCTLGSYMFPSSSQCGFSMPCTMLPIRFSSWTISAMLMLFNTQLLLVVSNCMSSDIFNLCTLTMHV